ncbi:MAG: septal ring lytic transglycosylase RlpA family protein [Patescibacteria group bacterium]
MWSRVTYILLSVSVLVCLFLVKPVHAATIDYGSSTFTQLFLDSGFLNRLVDLHLPEINFRAVFNDGDIPAPGVLTILTEDPKSQTSANGNQILSAKITTYWMTNAAEKPTSTLLTIYNDQCLNSTSTECAFEERYHGQLNLIHAIAQNGESATARIKIGADAQLVLIPRQAVEIPEDPGYMPEGDASWYAYKYCMCAASPDFPKGSYVKVTCADDESKSVVVRINDFGPERDIFPNRVIDLDKIAFEQLAPLGAGLVKVKVEPVQATEVQAASPAPKPVTEVTKESGWEF